MDAATRSRYAPILAFALLAVLVAACAVATAPTPTPVPTPTPTATPAPSQPPTLVSTIVPTASPLASGAAAAQVCADAADFQASIDALEGLDLETAGAVSVLQAVADTIRSGTALVDSAKAAFGPETQALAAALSGLQSALTGVTTDGTVLDKAASLENAIDAVAAAFDALKAELAPGCASPAPSAG